MVCVLKGFIMWQDIRDLMIYLKDFSVVFGFLLRNSIFIYVLVYFINQ